MDQKLYDLLFEVIYGHIREASQVYQIFSDVEKSLGEYYELNVKRYELRGDLLGMAKVAFLDGWPEDTYLPVKAAGECE